MITFFDFLRIFFQKKNQIFFGSHLKTHFLMSAAKSRWIWFLTEKCKSKCSLRFYAKQFRLVFPKLIYTFSNEQYCELKHFEKLPWNANFFQILNLNLSAEKKYLEKNYIITFFQFLSKDLLVDVLKLLSYVTGVLLGKSGEKFKKSYWFWMSRSFFPVFFPKLTFTRRVDFLGIQFDLKYFIYDNIVGF